MGLLLYMIYLHNNQYKLSKDISKVNLFAIFNFILIVNKSYQVIYIKNKILCNNINKIKQLNINKLNSPKINSFYFIIINIKKKILLKFLFYIYKYIYNNYVTLILKQEVKTNLFIILLLDKK